MATSTLERRARRQALIVAALAAIVVAGALVLNGRPDDASALKAEIAQLRSQAAEARLLQEEWRVLPTRFAFAHAEHLRRNVARERERLAGLQVERGLEILQRDAQRAASELQVIVERVATRSTQQGSSERAAALASMLAAMEDALRRR